jgi:predicted  nucleic acid-binding Zn-ribbon protein
MTQDVRNQISVLVRLQGIELEIQKHRQSLGRVGARTSELDSLLSEFAAAVESDQRRIRELNQSYRSQESELQLLQGRIEKSQEKLRSVKTNKEYQLGLKEVEDLGAMVSKIEDGMLGCLDEIEEAGQALRGHQARLDAEAGALRHQKEAILQEAEETRTLLQRREADAAELLKGVAPEVLALYRRVKAKKVNGIAVAAVCGSVCRGCNVNIPPQMYNELHRFDRLKNCPNCERIIYWDDEDSRSE